MDAKNAKTLIIGLGNPILTDDGVGVLVAEAVRAELSREDVDVQEVSVGGLTLMEAMAGYDRVILIDALYRRDGNPGAFHRLTLEELQSFGPPQHTTSPHDVNLPTALQMGRRMGMALPAEIVIYAVEVEDILDFGEEPTPAVAGAIPQVKEAVLAELERGV